MNLRENKNKIILMSAGVIFTLGLIIIVINAIIDIKINNLQKNLSKQEKIDLPIESPVMETEGYNSISNDDLNKMSVPEKEKVVNEIVSNEVNIENISGQKAQDIEVISVAEAISSSSPKSEKTQVIVSNGLVIGTMTGGPTTEKK